MIASNEGGTAHIEPTARETLVLMSACGDGMLSGSVEDVLLRAERHAAFEAWRQDILGPRVIRRTSCKQRRRPLAVRRPLPGAPPSARCNRFSVSGEKSGFFDED